MADTLELCETLSHKDLANIILKNSYFRIRHDIGTVHLEQVWLQPEPGLTGAGTADDQDVLVPGIGRILGSITHSQALRCRQDHVVLKLGIHEGLDISMGAP